MSETTRSQSVGFDAYSDLQKAFSPFDLFTTTDLPFAAQPEIFESELDSIGVDFEGLNPPAIFTIPRPETFYNAAPSVFTTSSDSAYDTGSTHSESFYNYPNSPYPPSNFLDMDLRGSEYGGSVALSNLDNANDPTSFGTLPPTPPRSPITTKKVYETGSFVNTPCFSDYSTTSGSVATDQFFSLEFGNASVHSTVSPMNVSAGSLVSAAAVLEEQKLDPRRKHKCSKCARAFARAFNLKTHMATHDPNRPKPHTCPHRNCGRSFSRKHDLGRHLTSIHRDESLARRTIGVAKAGRTWCDSCGKGVVGRSSVCDCHDVK